MATNGIEISLSEVSSTAQTIRTLNGKLKTDIENIKTEVSNLATYWQSDSGETLRSQINGMQENFDNYEKIIEAYAKFLDDTVNNYTQTENSINSKASGLK